MFVGESWSNGELVTEDHERMFKDGHMHSVSRTDDLVIECVEVLSGMHGGKHGKLSKSPTIFPGTWLLRRQGMG